VSLSKDGFKITTDKDIELTAKGGLKINADKDIELTAKGDLKITATNVKVQVSGSMDVS